MHLGSPVLSITAHSRAPKGDHDEMQRHLNGNASNGIPDETLPPAPGCCGLSVGSVPVQSSVVDQARLAAYSALPSITFKGHEKDLSG
jgi:hypothetical protein